MAVSEREFGDSIFYDCWFIFFLKYKKNSNFAADNNSSFNIYMDTKVHVALFHKIIASGFGSGFSPFAPGTMGALLATLIWMIGAFLFSPSELMVATVVTTVLFTILGIWSSGKVEAVWGKDPSKVVVDEMVGVWIPLIVCPGAGTTGWYWYMLLAFALFRFFDILKPLGIRAMEKLPSGTGIMMDDILSGVYSLIIIKLIHLCL